MSDERADRISHWLSVADDQDTPEKELAARYTAAAAARLWALHRLDDAPDDAPKEWAQVRELADQADKYLDDDRQDEALFRRAQANLVALQLFEDSGQRPASAEVDDSDEGDGDTGEHDQDGDAD
ncbi:MAG: hypothetical protein QOF88_1985 [Mycobacterium sp.]|jgi:hypothetical protein|nr:hypothetical protein [Mycobacterium sp.]MDT5287096.1 hypothetical protein [Mycobacterium sp.]MDT5364024.1 hypothetical protein [Mycobacterium sp.]